MTYAEKVKFVRAKLLLSQEELARQSGISFASINRWESGSKEPRLVTWAKFELFCNEHDIYFEGESKNGK